VRRSKKCLTFSQTPSPSTCARTHPQIDQLPLIFQYDSSTRAALLQWLSTDIGRACVTGGHPTLSSIRPHPNISSPQNVTKAGHSCERPYEKKVDRIADGILVFRPGGQSWQQCRRSMQHSPKNSMRTGHRRTSVRSTCFLTVPDSARQGRSDRPRSCHINLSEERQPEVIKKVSPGNCGHVTLITNSRL
jgi:hypothetical protein